MVRVGRRAKDARMIVVTDRIPVVRGHEIDFEDRLKLRVVGRHPRFVRNEVPARGR